MAPINRNSISLYEDAKATFISLLQQTAQVGVGFIIMLLLTGGNPPGIIMGSSFVLGVGFVAWSENKRLERLTTSEVKSSITTEKMRRIDNAANEAIVTSSKDINLDSSLFKNTSINKRAILKAKINLIFYPTTLLEIKTLIQEVLLIETDNFQDLTQAVDLDIKKDFAGSNLGGANLEGANLEGANLEGANLWGSILKDAILVNAILVDAILARANLEGADLKDANVVEARFGYNKGLSDEMIKDLIERGAIFIDSQSDYSSKKIS